jgi:hypothetical protein
MFDAAAADDAVPPAASRAEERMRLLRRMSEVGVRMAERLDRQSELCAIYAEAEASPEQHREPNARRLDDIARAFAQVSRAVSVSVALEDRIERGPPPAPLAERHPPALRLVEPEGPPESLPRSNLGARREQAARAVRRAIDADAAGDPRRTAELCLGLDRLLDRELAAVDAFLDRPLDEIVARVSRALGLTASGEAGDTEGEPEPRAPGPPACDPPAFGARERGARDTRGPRRDRSFRPRLGASP